MQKQRLLPDILRELKMTKRFDIFLMKGQTYSQTYVSTGELTNSSMHSMLLQVNVTSDLTERILHLFYPFRTSGANVLFCV